MGDLQLFCLFIVCFPVANKANMGGSCDWVCCSYPGRIGWFLVFFEKNRFFFIFSRARLCVFSFFLCLFVYVILPYFL